jgi:hypothetical protein
MTMTRGSRASSRLASLAGYSLIEMMVAMGVSTVVMGATMAGLSDIAKGSEMVVNVTEMNKSLRIGMDLIERDMLQVGSGLPPGHTINVATGAGATQVKIPGPPTQPGYAAQPILLALGDPDISAVQPSPGKGPVINGVATDVLTVLMADNALLDVPLTASTATTATLAWSTSPPYSVAAPGPNITTGPDKVSPGQLMMIWKGALTTLVEVTSVDTAGRVLTFASGDALNLNQTAAAAGNLAYLNAQGSALSWTAVVPGPPLVTELGNTFITRVRMVTYYLDATLDPTRPRLVRRVNNGSPTVFDNASGTSVAMDVENLTFRFDINDGNLNPASVQMNAADLAGTGACNPNPCSINLIRKVDIVLTGRSRNVNNPKARSFHNTLTSQVSFRGMAFVDEYLSHF